jgi:hypothetical protein
MRVDPACSLRPTVVDTGVVVDMDVRRVAADTDAAMAVQRAAAAMAVAAEAARPEDAEAAAAAAVFGSQVSGSVSR